MIVGFVFKANDKLYVTEYSDDGQFTDGRLINNEEPYEELGENQLAFVSIIKYESKEGDIIFNLKDHGFCTLENKFRKDIKGYEVLLDLDCREGLCEIIEDLKNEIELKMVEGKEI